MRGASELLLIDWSIHGQSRFVMEHLVAKVEHLASVARMKSFYIGKASGDDPFEALARRDDSFKQDSGLNLAMAIYRTRDQRIAAEVEEFLIDEFWNHSKLVNSHRGSAGRPTRARLSFVYIACRMWPAPDVDEFYQPDDE